MSSHVEPLQIAAGDGKEMNPTIIEDLAAHHQDAMGGDQADWGSLDAGARRQRIEAMQVAIALLPESHLYELRVGGRQFLDLRQTRNGLIEEQAIKDERKLAE